MTTSFSDRLALQEATCLFLLQSRDEQDNPAFAYLAVSGEKLADFRAALNQPLFDAGDFGEILLSGAGTPSAEAQREMASRYGFDHAQMQTIPLG